MVNGTAGADPSDDLAVAGCGGGQRAAGRGEPGPVDQATPRPPPHRPGRICRLQPGRRPLQRHPLVRHPGAGHRRGDLGRGHRRPPQPHPANPPAAGTRRGRGADRRAPTGHRSRGAGQLLPAHPHRRPHRPGPWCSTPSSGWPRRGPSLQAATLAAMVWALAAATNPSSRPPEPPSPPPALRTPTAGPTASSPANAINRSS
jgi:hypothetical protein